MEGVALARHLARVVVAQRQMQVVKNIVWIWILLLSTPLLAQDTETFVPSAPTSFQSDLEEEANDDLEEALRDEASVWVNSNGAFGRFATFNIRGTDSNEVGISLEGIPLSSPAQGSFDLSQMSLFGIEDAQLIRGGYSSFSTYSFGYLNLRLPNEQKFKTKIAYGSYDYYSFGQLTPNASFSFERADNDFLFSSGNAFLRRERNESIRYNLRAWNSFDNHRIFAIVNVLNRDLPAPTNDLDADFETHFVSISPMIAYQGRYESWSWASWAKFEEQEVESPTSLKHNRLWYSGQQFEYRQDPLSILSLKHGLQFTQDYLFNADFASKNRYTLAAHSAAYWAPFPQHMIHPRIRAEFVSDLSEPISAHPGIGGRHPVVDNLDMLWNFSYVSRAPSFNELYYELGSFISNPDLDREQSVQGDLGYEFRYTPLNLYWTQAAFWLRKFDTIVFREVNPNEYQSVNSGTQVNWGLEQDLSSQPLSFIRFNATYTYLHASLSERQAPYQARHKLTLTPKWMPTDFLELSLPAYARSSVYTAEGSDTKLGPQFDLGARMETNWDRWMLSMEAFNLLQWQREEFSNYPMPQETYFKLTAEYNF